MATEAWRARQQDLSMQAMIRDAAHHLLKVEVTAPASSTHDTLVASGVSLEFEVQPGLWAAAHDLTWFSDGFSESMTMPALHCGLLLAGESQPLYAEDSPPVSYRLNRAMVTSFDKPTRCARQWRGGTRSYGAGFVLAPEFLDSFGALIKEDGLSVLRSLLEDGFRAVELPASPRLSEIARGVIENPYTGQLGGLFAEANTLRFVVEAAALLHEEAKVVRQIGQWHYQRACEAREILDQSLAQPPKALDIARQVGLSLTTLQKNFRMAFGTTMFGYVRDQRLSLARFLIQDQGIGSAEAGYRVGYGNAAAFTAAYRRQFGRPPSDDR